MVSYQSISIHPHLVHPHLVENRKPLLGAHTRPAYLTTFSFLFLLISASCMHIFLHLRAQPVMYAELQLFIEAQTLGML